MKIVYDEKLWLLVHLRLSEQGVVTATQTCTLAACSCVHGHRDFIDSISAMQLIEHHIETYYKIGSVKIS